MLRCFFHSMLGPWASSPIAWLQLPSVCWWLPNICSFVDLCSGFWAKKNLSAECSSSISNSASLLFPLTTQTAVPSAPAFPGKTSDDTHSRAVHCPQLPWLLHLPEPSPQSSTKQQVLLLLPPKSLWNPSLLLNLFTPELVKVSFFSGFLPPLSPFLLYLYCYLCEFSHVKSRSSFLA